MSRTLTFTRTASVTLDGSGNGTAQTGPAVPGEIWRPDSASISCTGSIPATGTPAVFLYAGETTSASCFVDSTYNVTGASSSMISGKTLYAGQQISAVWSNGPPGQVATLIVKGTRQVP